MKKNFLFILMLVVTVNELRAASIALLLAKSAGDGLIAAYERVGFSKGAATQAEESVKYATEILLQSSKRLKGDVTEANIKKAFEFNPQLAKILAKDESEVSEADLVKLVNLSALEAELKGADFVCAQCVQKDMLARGIKGILKKSSSSFKMAPDKVVNMTHSKFLSEIKKMAKKLNMSKEDLDEFLMLPDEAKKTTYVALDFMKNGNRSQQELGVAIDKFNRFGEKTFYSKNKILNLLTEDLKSSEIASWIDVLNKLSKERPVDQVEGRVANLREYFEQRVSDRPKLEADLDYLKANGCFGIFKR